MSEPTKEFRCSACGICFSTDLEPEEVRHCPLCAHPNPEPIAITERKELCSECAGKPRQIIEHTEQEFIEALRAAFNEVPDPS